jgi:hypothetical protein
VFDLRAAVPFDGPNDLPPPACPEIGELPTFRGGAQALPVAGCHAYAIGAPGGIAVCGADVARGEPDQAVSPIAFDPPAYILAPP